MIIDGFSAIFFIVLLTLFTETFLISSKDSFKKIVSINLWGTINCTHAGSHPYVDAWWPDAHPIGYEHTFTNMAYNMLCVLAGRKPIIPIPDFADAYQTQRVLEAVLISAQQKRPVKLSEIK